MIYNNTPPVILFAVWTANQELWYHVFSFVNIVYFRSPKYFRQADTIRNV